MDLNGNVLIKKRKMRKNSLVFFYWIFIEN